MMEHTQIEPTALRLFSDVRGDQRMGEGASESKETSTGSQRSARIRFRIVDENRLFQFLASGSSLPTV
jgi:hypothetical protein